MKDLKKEVESLGVFYEKSGMTPMQARVFALLLLSDPPHLDFFAIRDFMGASKSAVSNAVNRLMDINRVDYLTFPGDRKRYFKVNPEKWLQQMKLEISSVGPILITLNKVISKRADMDTPEFNRELRRVHQFFAYMAVEFPKMLRRWEELNENEQIT